MATMSDFKVGGVYSFDTYAPEVLGLKIKNAKVLAILDSQNALSQGLDIHSYHQRIRSHLPSGFNDDPTTMVYIKLRNTTGMDTIMALDWINSVTIVEEQLGKITVVFNGVGHNDVDVIRQMAIANGYTNFTLTIGEA